jgi:diguanylate cyclase (GGDEF)-like protein
VHVADRLRSAVRAEDFVARFGGDELVVVRLEDPDGLEQETAQRLADALRQPIDLGPLTTTTRASVGSVVLRPGTRTTPEKVLSAADTRMYETKRGRAPGVHPGLAPSAGSAGPA